MTLQLQGKYMQIRHYRGDLWHSFKRSGENYGGWAGSFSLNALIGFGWKGKDWNGSEPLRCGSWRLGACSRGLQGFFFIQFISSFVSFPPFGRQPCLCVTRKPAGCLISCAPPRPFHSAGLLLSLIQAAVSTSSYFSANAWGFSFLVVFFTPFHSVLKNEALPPTGGIIVKKLKNLSRTGVDVSNLSDVSVSPTRTLRCLKCEEKLRQTW